MPNEKLSDLELFIQYLRYKINKIAGGQQQNKCLYQSDGYVLL